MTRQKLFQLGWWFAGAPFARPLVLFPVYCPSCALITSSTCALTASRLKEAGACIGGNSMAVFASFRHLLLHENEAPELAGIEVVHVAAAHARSGSRRGSTASARTGPGGG